MKALRERVPRPTAAVLLQPFTPLSLSSTAKVDRLPSRSALHTIVSPLPRKDRFLSHLAGTATHALAPSVQQRSSLLCTDMLAWHPSIAWVEWLCREVEKVGP